MPSSSLRALPALAAFFLLAAWGCVHPAPPAVPTPYASESCPLPPGAINYTVVARAADSTLADQAYLRLVARAVARRWDRDGWKVRPRGGHAEKSHADSVPASPWLPQSELFGKNGWRPRPGQRAELELAIRRDGTWSAPSVVGAEAAGDSAFVRIVLGNVAHALALAPPPLGRFDRDSVPHALPAAAAGAGADSVVVRLLFGESPRPEDRAVARFAVSERPVRVTHFEQPAYPPELLQTQREGDAVLQWVVDSAGHVDFGSLRVLRTTDAGFAREAVRVLPRFSFAPAELDCAPVSQLVQMPFKFRLGPPYALPSPSRR